MNKKYINLLVVIIIILAPFIGGFMYLLCIKIGLGDAGSTAVSISTSILLVLIGFVWFIISDFKAK